MSRVRTEQHHGFKRSVVPLTVICGGLALAIGLYLRPWLSAGSAQAIGPADALPSVASAPEGVPPPAEPGALTRTVNGITVSATNFRRVGNQVQADVCLVRPDDGDWLIHRAGLRYSAGGAETEVSDFSGTPNEGMTPPVQGPHAFRCDTLAFDLPTGADPASVTLAIQTIGALPREGEVCTTYLAKVQSALDARRAGIRVGCEQHEWGDQLVVTGKPATMSQAEAEGIVHSDGFYSVDGPWLFSTDLQPDGG